MSLVDVAVRKAARRLKLSTVIFRMVA